MTGGSDGSSCRNPSEDMNVGTGMDGGIGGKSFITFIGGDCISDEE